MKRLKKALPIIAAVLVFVTVFTLLNMLLVPKYTDPHQEGGRMLAQYYKEAGGHDVIFLGDCDVYANFSPMEMWRNYGITAYVRGSSQQFIWQSYHLLEETLTYEIPTAVVFNVNAIQYGKDDDKATEEQNRMTMDQLRWSVSKFNMVRQSMKDNEDFWSYLFPILRYHDRFDKLTAADFRYLFSTPDVTFNGYLPNHGVEPMGRLPSKRPLPSSYDFPGECYDYLDKMAALCKEKGIELILIRSPRQQNPYWYDRQDQLVQAYADKNGLAYYNFSHVADEIGLDFKTDTYDRGEHLNHAGAVKLSTYFAGILAEKHGIADHRTDNAIAATYNEKLKKYDEAIKTGKEKTK